MGPVRQTVRYDTPRSCWAQRHHPPVGQDASHMGQLFPSGIINPCHLARLIRRLFVRVTVLPQPRNTTLNFWPTQPGEEKAGM